MNQKHRVTTKQLVMAAMCTALMAVLSPLSIPMPVGVPLTLQTMIIALSGYLLGWRLGLLATGTYVMLGVVGLPVFAGYNSGMGVLFGMTGGFIFGFFVIVVLCGLPFQKTGISIPLGLTGIGICHVFGIIQFSLVTSNTVLQSFLLVSLPYVPKDLVSVIAAYYLAAAVRKSLHAAHLTNYPGE
jgi:biotin transport system substrate-specific component